MICLPSSLYGTSDFQALKKAYPQYSDSDLADFLALWMEKYGYKVDQLPTSGSRKMSFTKFLKRQIDVPRNKTVESEMAKIVEQYQELGIYDAKTLEDRVGFLAQEFSAAVNEYHAKPENKNKSRKRCIEELGGYRGIMKKVRNLVKSGVDSDFWYNRIRAAKKRWTDEDCRDEAEYRAGEFKLMLEHFDALSSLVSRKVSDAEHIVVKYNSESQSFNEEENDFSEDKPQNNTEDGEGAKGDRFVDFRALRFEETISSATNTFLHSIPARNKNLTLVRDDIGQVKMMDNRQVGYKMLEIFGQLDPTIDFLPQLEGYVSIYPWMYDVVDALKKQPDMRTCIYCDFMRAIYKYDHIRTDDNATQYEWHYENTSDGQNAFARRASNIMRAGIPLNEFSVFGASGLKSASERTEDGTEDYSPDKVAEHLGSIADSCRRIVMRNGLEFQNKTGSEYELMSNPVEAMKKLLADLEESGDLDYIQKAFVGVGMDVSKEMIKSVAMEDISEKTGRIIQEMGVGGISHYTAKTEDGYVAAHYAGNRFYIMLECLSGIYSDVKDRVGKGKRNIDSFLALDSVVKDMKGLNIMLAPGLSGNVEPSVLVGDKRLQTYNKPNLLHEVFDMFAQDGLLDRWKKEDDIENQKRASEAYGRYYEQGRIEEARAASANVPKINRRADWFKAQYTDCEGFTVDGQPVGWLEKLMNKGIRLTLTEATMFNGVEYAKMSPAQKITSAIVRYVKDSQFEVPIMADYSSAYNFVKGPSSSIGNSTSADYEEKDSHSTMYEVAGEVKIDGNSDIVENVIDEVFAELEVVEAARKRLKAAEEGKWNKLGKYDERASKFQLFKEFNDNGFYEELSAIPKERKNERRDLVRRYVVDQLTKIAEADMKYFADLGILNNDLLIKTLSLSVEERDGKMYASKSSYDKLLEFSLNTLYGREQITKLLNGGLAQFGSIADFEKRAMMNHAPASPFYKYATWNGKKAIRDGFQRVVYVKDSIAPSSYKEEIAADLKANLLDTGKITPEQYEYFVSAYDGIKEGDGQGFRTLDSWREIMIGTNHWSDNLEQAFNAIKSGRWTSADIDALIRGIEYFKNFKPRYAGYETIKGYDGGKNIKLSVSHKYAETVLLPEALLDFTMKGASVPYRAMSKAAKELGVDMFIFTSGVKVNAHSEVDVFSTKNGERELKSSDSIAESIVSQVKANPHSIHTLDLKYYGEAASTPVHVMDASIAWAAQAETMAFADLEDDDIVFFGGKQRTAKEARELYQRIKFSEALAAWRRLEDKLRNPVELEKMLQEELAEKSYNSPELRFALSRIGERGFAMPLFSSSVQHEVEELMTSAIRKRISSHKTKGTNIFQSSSFGLDVPAVAFEDEGLGESARLKIEWENKGKPNQRIKYIECYMPITDSWLLKFADDNGAIPPARLQALIDEGKIPESILYAVGYRTPSDGVHSLFPLKIKGFTSNIEGANILLPREAMTLAGLDFDGDKLRVHLKSFKPSWDEDLIRSDYERRASSDENLVKVALGQKQMKDVDVEGTYEEFEEGIKNKYRKDLRYFRLEAEDYDYDLNPEDQSSAARDNARIDLIFANLTSVSGTAKMLIPGGAEETVRMAKAFYIIRQLGNEDVRNILSKNGFRGADFNPSKAYDKLSAYDNNRLDDLISKIEGYTTPFSAKHAAQAHETIVGGKQMVPVFATQNALMQTLQYAGLRYKPYEYKEGSKKGQSINMSFLGTPIDTLYGKYDVDKKSFVPRNKNNTLLSRIHSRFLNAAVDNAKEPVLGMINQCPELAPITNFFIAAGVEEDELDLLMTQPVMFEIAKRIKEKKVFSVTDAINDLLVEMTGDKDADSTYKVVAEASKFNSLKREELFDCVPLGFSDVLFKKGETNNYGVTQLKLLYGLAHLAPAITELNDLCQIIRPESHSGTMGSSIAENLLSAKEISSFVRDGGKHITGARMSDSMKYIDTDMSDSEIWKEFGWMPYESLLNSLFFTNSIDFFQDYFPQVAPSWRAAIDNMMDKVNTRNAEKTMGMITREMVLWTLFSNASISGTDPQSLKAMREYLVLKFPEEVKALLKRIRNAKEDDDPSAFELKDNMFLSKLSVEDASKWSKRPKIVFRSGGPSIGGFADNVRRDWGQMLRSEDPSIRKAAIDLYTYNLFTSGFGFGMYEFAHLAPFDVIAAVPGYLQALRSCTGMQGIFPDVKSAQYKNWYDQFMRNHWDDSTIVRHLSPKHIPAQYRTIFGYAAETKDKGKAISDDLFVGLDYFVLVSKEYDGNRQRTVKTLYKHEFTGREHLWHKVEPLGFKGKKGQYLLTYDPRNSGDDVHPAFLEQEVESEKTPKRAASASNISKAKAGKLESLAGTKVGAALEAVRAKMAEHNDEVVKAAAEEEKNGAPATPQVQDDRPTDTTEKPEQNPQERPVENTENDNVAEIASMFKGKVDDATAAALAASMPAHLRAALKGKKLGFIRQVIKPDGTIEYAEQYEPVTPGSVREARRQKAFVRLNKKLTKILNRAGVGIGTLYDFEERLGLAGITDFDTAEVTANGLIELIRLSHGKGGLEALPEEFSHLAIEMLGHDHPLVRRLLDAVASSEEAMREAFGNMYDVYVEKYSSEFSDDEQGRQQFRDKMILEAAGKLVAKNLLYQEEVNTGFLRRIIKRVVDAIKDFFRTKFDRHEIKDAILDAQEISSQLARELMSGRVSDLLKVENVRASGKMLSAKQDISRREDIMGKLLQNATKRMSVFESRLRFAKETNKQAITNAAKRELENLEASIDKLSLEEGVYKYLGDSLDFLAEVERVLDEVANDGTYGMNTVCRYLRIYGDAMNSVASALADIKKSISDGEFDASPDFMEVYKKTVGVVDAFGVKYQKLSTEYFENLLRGFYGPHGKTITIGKDKGKTITIEEMARRAEHDITLASRFFHSLADCNDLALKAFDNTVRNAKNSARKRTAANRAKIEEAFERLVRETGSRDQSFMFQYEMKDGKRVKNGLYITEEDAKKLSPAKKHFYDVMMEIKHEIDSYLPESEVGPLKIVMITKSHMERAADSASVKEGALELWEGVRNSILDTSDNIDYENEQVRVDFAGNRIDMLPIHYVRKAPNLTFDDMSDDVASTILAYAGMGNEYNELSGIIDWLEVSKDAASRRDIVMKTGRKTQIETINDESSDYTYSKPYTTSQFKSHMQDALNDYFHMHLYNGLQRDEGTIGNTRIDKRKAANMLNHFASLSQMAVNLQQRISNVSTGLAMIVIESAGKGEFNAKDIGWATKIYLKHTPDRLLGFGSTNNDNKLSLWIDYHDVTNDNGREDKNKRYGKSRTKRVLNENLLYSGMLAGEDYLASVTSLALARKFKVKNTKTNKIETLWDAYEVAYVDPANKSGAYLKLKDGYVKEDGTPITKEDEFRFSKHVAGVNFELQGIYNLDDKSAIQQYALGALIIMYRKWIAPALKRRYGGVDYSSLKEQDVEGYYRTAGRLIGDVYQNIRVDGENLMTAVKMAWSKMNDYEKGNCRKAMTELGIILGCVVAIAGLSKWEPDDDDDMPKAVSWLDHQFLYQLMRLRNEVGSQAPTPMLVDEASKLLKSPMAATRPLAAGLDAFQLLVPSNYFTEVRSGRYKGHTKAHKYFFDLPIISMTRNIHNFEDPSSLIKFYNSKSY